jgi:hypothetical protein
MKVKKKKVVLLVSILVVVLLTVTVSIRLIFFGAGDVDIRMVSGTEYISGEYGQVIVRLADYKGEAVTGANCNTTILYPDKSYFMLDQSLQSSTVPGNYYREFLTPTVNGIYEETITCKSDQGGETVTSVVSSSFHVSVALNFIVELSQQQAVRYADLVRMINDTQVNLNDTREQLINEINETFSYDVIQKIEQSESNITKSINDSRQELNQSITSTFDSMQERMVSLGTSIVGIFGTE